jgi:hypothetical protein
MERGARRPNMTSKIGDVIKQWIKENETDCGGYFGTHCIPETALPILEKRISSLLSATCPERKYLKICERCVKVFEDR